MTSVNMILLALLFGVAGIGLIAFGVREFVLAGDRINRRLAGQGGSAATGAGARLVEDDTALRSLENILTPKDEERQSRIAKRLALAGYRNPAAVRIYFAAKWGVAVVGFALASVLFAATMDPAKPHFAIISTLLTVTTSFFAADMQLERRTKYRRMAVEKAFPDALDLMLVCIEAGQGLDQAIARVSIEIERSAPVLAEELRLVMGQLRAGKERAKVLADFSERVGVEDVAAFVTVIRQADKFGVSIADTLRVYASEMRNKRYMRAEEKANMMPVQLALGAIIFTVPPTIIVLIGPSIIMIAREMMKAANTASG
jgi:tight adherence protein C